MFFKDLLAWFVLARNLYQDISRRGQLGNAIEVSRIRETHSEKHCSGTGRDYRVFVIHVAVSIRQGDDMKTKAGSQLVQAVLFMLAMVCMLWLLPGNDTHKQADCRTQEATSSPQMKSWAQIIPSCPE